MNDGQRVDTRGAASAEDLDDHRDSIVVRRGEPYEFDHDFVTWLSRFRSRIFHGNGVGELFVIQPDRWKTKLVE